MITLIIALLLSFGIIDTPDDYNNASTHQKTEYQKIIGDEFDEF